MFDLKMVQVHIFIYFLKVVLLSATMPADVLDVTKKFMREPVRILVKKEELTLEGIRQFYINVEKEVREEISVGTRQGRRLRLKLVKT